MSVNTHATTSCSCDMSTHATRRRFAQAHSPSTIFSAGVVSLSGLPNIEALRKGLDLALIWIDCIYFFVAISSPVWATPYPPRSFEWVFAALAFGLRFAEFGQGIHVDKRLVLRIVCDQPT